MQYPYYIVRKINRAIDWFFKPETEKIYCTDWQEIGEQLQEGDIIFALDNCGSYQQVNSIEEAILVHKGNDYLYKYMKAKAQAYTHERTNDWAY